MVVVGDREYQESCPLLLQILRLGVYAAHASVRSEPLDPPKELGEFALESVS